MGRWTPAPSSCCSIHFTCDKSFHSPTILPDSFDFLWPGNHHHSIQINAQGKLESKYNHLCDEDYQPPLDLILPPLRQRTPAFPTLPSESHCSSQIILHKTKKQIKLKRPGPSDTNAYQSINTFQVQLHRSKHNKTLHGFIFVCELFPFCHHSK